MERTDAPTAGSRWLSARSSARAWARTLPGRIAIGAQVHRPNDRYLS